MPSQTYQVDLTALARAHHASTPPTQRSAVGGSFGVGLAPSITGYEFVYLHGLVDKTAPTSAVAMVKVDQAWANYTLADDAGGRFKLVTEEDRVVVDEEGYAYIVATGLPVDLADVSYSLSIGVQIGVTTVQYTHGFQVMEAPPKSAD